MNIKFRNSNFRKFQEGGAMEAPVEEAVPVGVEEAPVAEAPADPMEMLMQLAQMAAQALQAQDANMAMEVCNGLVEFVQILQSQAAPQEAPAEPVYRRGGTLVKRIRK